MKNITVYEYNELSEKTKKKVLKKYMNKEWMDIINDEWNFIQNIHENELKKYGEIEWRIDDGHVTQFDCETNLEQLLKEKVITEQEYKLFCDYEVSNSVCIKGKHYERIFDYSFYDNEVCDLYDKENDKGITYTELEHKLEEPSKKILEFFKNKLEECYINLEAVNDALFDEKSAEEHLANEEWYYTSNGAFVY